MYYAVTLPFRTPFSIMTDCTEFAQLLPLEFGQYAAKASSPLKNHVEITKASGEYRFSSPVNTSVVKDPMLALTSFIYSSIPFAESVLPFHGAALSYGGKAYLFLAPTCGGKTTLAAYLLHCGCGYLSDDCILVDKATLHVHPSATPLHLREGGYAVLQKLHAQPAETYSLKTPRDMRIAYTPENTVQTPLPIGGIYFINRSETENSAVSLSAKERVEILLASQTVYKMDLKTIISLAGYNCQRITYSDMHYVFDILRAADHCCAKKSSTIS